MGDGLLSRARRLAVSWLLLLFACAVEPQPPRIVLIVIDTLRRDKLSLYGSTPLPTPHIDALAARGRTYDHFSASYHQTSMSMAALFTGRTPSLETRDPKKPLAWTGQTWCGMARFAERGEDLCLPGSLPTLAERLHETGYWTIGIASNEMLFEPSGFGRGFDDFVEVGRAAVPGQSAENAWRERTWPHVNRSALAALERRPRDPIFLYVHYMDVHDWGYQHASYAEAVARADAGVGALLADLERQGLLDDAVVVLTSDHGEHLGERHPPHPNRARRTHQGNPSYEALLAVPLIIAPAPDAGDPLHELPLHRTQDLYRWLLGVAGVAPDSRAEDTKAGELFLSERAWQTYRGPRYKSAFDRRSSRVVLFDLEQDPGEQHNRAKQNPDVLALHRERVATLGARMAADPGRLRELSAEDRARLEALGYSEPD